MNYLIQIYLTAPSWRRKNRHNLCIIIVHNISTAEGNERVWATFILFYGLLTDQLHLVHYRDQAVLDIGFNKAFYLSVMLFLLFFPT